MKKLLIIISFILSGSFLFADSIVVKVEAESYVKETKGKVVKVDGRPETSGNTCITTWNDKDHVLEWDVVIPEAGLYAVAFRYANGRAWTVYRDLKIDGVYPSDAFKKIKMDTTGGFSKTANNWKNLVISGNGKPSIVNLSKGKHHIVMTNLGGDDDQDGACNFDVIGFLGKDADASVLGK